MLDGCGGGSGGGSGVAPAAEPRGGAPQGSRWLRVSGPRIVDDVGRPFRLVGMGLSPIHSEWTLGGASSVGDVAAHYRTLGCNSMRIGFASSHTYDQSSKHEL